MHLLLHRRGRRLIVARAVAVVVNVVIVAVDLAVAIVDANEPALNSTKKLSVSVA
jgi:hypothetical protein